MSEKKVLVVLGATGTQGGAVLRYLVRHEPNKFTLRGITRNPASQASRDVQALGVDIVKADNDDLASLKAALSGATHVFANTDSNQHIFYAMKHPEVLGPGETPLTYARDIEMQQGRNIVEALAATESLESVVWSTLASPAKWSKGKYTNVTMFDAKEAIGDLFWAEEKLKGKVSMVIVGFYLTNALKMPELQAPKKVSLFALDMTMGRCTNQQRQQPDGVFELALLSSGDVLYPHADVDADLGSWVSALFQAEAGVTLVGASEMLTWKDWLKLWADRNGVQARYRQAVISESATGIKKAVQEEFQFVDEYGLAGGNPGVIHPADVAAEQRY
ncbi:hypothetical protein LTR97_007582 [Elasticomyces elasticus]|uniref:NmrA-like domain-containing protein n=1 Tax=Elasticomyces elasticus TaxID=574655 RepID=A0AAN7W8H7_9PEZI|nr:hypothetical protein LTR97_007582 [Elasticomyces elasticus]